MLFLVSRKLRFSPQGWLSTSIDRSSDGEFFRGDAHFSNLLLKFGQM